MIEESPEKTTPEQPSADQRSSAEPPVPVPAELNESNREDSAPEGREAIAGPIEKNSDKMSPTKRFFPLDPRSIRVEQVTGLIIFLALAIAALVGLVISYFAGEQPIGFGGRLPEGSPPQPVYCSC